MSSVGVSNGAQLQCAMWPPSRIEASNHNMLETCLERKCKRVNTNIPYWYILGGGWGCLESLASEDATSVFVTIPYVILYTSDALYCCSTACEATDCFRLQGRCPPTEATCNMLMHSLQASCTPHSIANVCHRPSVECTLGLVHLRTSWYLRAIQFMSPNVVTNFPSDNMFKGNKDPNGDPMPSAGCQTLCSHR